jgi:Ca-activated chloride channel homolog
VFDDEAQTVIPLQQAADKQQFNRRIDEIVEGGSTNLTGGWMLGRDELRKAPRDVTRRLLLLTDGALNHGIVEPAAVGQVVVSGLEQDAIRTSCLGFGDDYNEDLLAALARATNGQFHDASSAEKFAAIFAAELDGLQKISVQNLRLRLKRLNFCDGYTPLGDYPRVQLPDGREEFALGDLVSEEERIVCFGVQVLPLPLIDGKPAFTLEGEELLMVEVAWDELVQDGIASRQLTQLVRIQATQDPAEVVMNGDVIPWVSLQKAGSVVAEATRQMDGGKRNDAVQALENTIHELGGYGPAAAEAVRTLEDMKGKIRDGLWSVRERKSACYRSASYLKMSSKDIWTGDDQAPSFKQPAAGDKTASEPKQPE